MPPTLGTEPQNCCLPKNPWKHDEGMGKIAPAVVMPCSDFFPLLESSPGARLSKGLRKGDHS